MIQVGTHPVIYTLCYRLCEILSTTLLNEWQNLYSDIEPACMWLGIFWYCILPRACMVNSDLTFDNELSSSRCI